MHRRFIYVPKTVKDMKLDWCDEKSADVYEWRLSKDEFQALWDCGVFDYLNKKFNVLIDEFEEEWIMYQFFYIDYERLVKELNKFSCRNEVRMLIEMINRAIESRTYVGFIL